VNIHNLGGLMSEELRAVLDKLVDYMNTGVSNEHLVALLLEIYPVKEDETRADTLCRMQAEVDELFEGLIGAVWRPEDEM
jgi:hypothetical protein